MAGARGLSNHQTPAVRDPFSWSHQTNICVHRLAIAISPLKMSMPPQGMVPQQIPPQGQPPQQQIPMTGVTGDLVSQVRSLVYELKKCLTNLMVVTASNIVHNSQIDTGAKTAESKAARFDKSLEEFFSLCNQIERHLVSESIKRRWRVNKQKANQMASA